MTLFVNGTRDRRIGERRYTREREKEDWFQNQSPIKATQAKKHDGPTLLRINPF